MFLMLNKNRILIYLLKIFLFDQLFFYVSKIRRKICKLNFQRLEKNDDHILQSQPNYREHHVSDTLCTTNSHHDSTWETADRCNAKQQKPPTSTRPVSSSNWYTAFFSISSPCFHDAILKNERTRTTDTRLDPQSGGGV